MKYAYYTGCTSKRSTAEADQATRAVARELGIELVELASAGCCGSCELKAADPGLALSVNARILALAERQGLDVLTICDTCHFNVRSAAVTLEKDPARTTKINAGLDRIGLRYTGTVRVKSFLEVMLDDVGIEALAKRFAGSLGGLRAAPFACCHSFRPVDMRSVDGQSRLEQLLETLGTAVTPRGDDANCCGFHTLLVNEPTALSAAAGVLSAAHSAGAECLVTSSPLCHIALDTYQKNAGQASARRFNLPVLHLSQVVGLALGLPAASLGLGRHMVRTESVVRKVIPLVPVSPASD